ncbi:MAG TPA: sialate O-acetylesterase, partial [Chitinophagaceae bacterium]
MKRFLLHCLGCCFTSLFFLPSFSQVRLPRLISSGMVLQRDKPVNIWGWASAGEKITVSFNNNTYTTAAADDGEWSVVLPPLKAGGPYDMKVSGINTITLDNIMMGEVWVCSGQSNMELPMERVRDKYEDIIASSTNSLIRQFNDETRYNFQSPQQDLASGAWEMANPQSVLHFSATAYFFARQLYEKYHVAIGLIKASVGGSPAEAWLSEDALRAFPAYLAIEQKWKNTYYLDSVKNADNVVSNNWYNRLWQDDQGLHGEKKWYDPAYDASAWPVMQMPGLWEAKGLPAMYGVVWMRKEINLPASAAGKPGRLLLGTIIDRDSTFINGVFTGTTGYQYPP